MLLIVIIGVAVGSVLPLLFSRFKIDPAHASAAIQVIMDITGVTVVMLVCQVRVYDINHRRFSCLTTNFSAA